MICGSCERDNDPKRRYCGKCGFNLQPACRKCKFMNASDDRFCGGCGALLVATHGCSVRRTVHPLGGETEPARITSLPLEMAAPPPPPTIQLADELGGLFGTAIVVSEAPALPEGGIGQDDLDRLFGVGP